MYTVDVRLDHLTAPTTINPTKPALGSRPGFTSLSLVSDLQGMHKSPEILVTDFNTSRKFNDKPKVMHDAITVDGQYPKLGNYIR